MVNFRNQRNPLYFILVTVYSVVKPQLHPQVEAARDEGAWYEAIKGDLVKAWGIVSMGRLAIIPTGVFLLSWNLPCMYILYIYMYTVTYLYNIAIENHHF